MPEKIHDKNLNKICSAILFGVAVGDAIGVPVEFLSRSELKHNPVTEMKGFGTHNMPPGTFSDDSSLTFCLAEALTKDFSIDELADNLIRWLYEGYWTANGEVFDVGIATNQAIRRLKAGCKPTLAGGFEEEDNGNGSMMRILPLLPYLLNKKIDDRFEIIRDVSALTHGHIRSVIACFYYLEFAINLLYTKDKKTAYADTAVAITEHLSQLQIDQYQISKFDRLLKNDISVLSENLIHSSGYVLHTLEASIWCLMTSDNYADSVLKAVNLGLDTDTTAAVTGGLAALAFGVNNIPTQWMQVLARKDDIGELAYRLSTRFS